MLSAVEAECREGQWTRSTAAGDWQVFWFKWKKYRALSELFLAPRSKEGQVTSMPARQPTGIYIFLLSLQCVHSEMQPSSWPWLLRQLCQFPINSLFMLNLIWVSTISSTTTWPFLFYEFYFLWIRNYNRDQKYWDYGYFASATLRSPP